MASPVFQWDPRDDLLLKNSLEAGASLESLAKGAVQFSRQFTIQELHDRWCSLLYDPIASEQAAAHMIEADNFESTNQSKSNKPGSIKGIVGNSDKRKAESVQRCYYSMRKRICSEPVNITAANPLSEPGYINSGFGVTKEPQCTDSGIGDPSYEFDQIGAIDELPEFKFPETENLHNGLDYSEYGGTSFPHIGHSSLIDQIRNSRDNTDYNLLSEFGEGVQSSDDQPLSGVNEFLTEDYLAELYAIPNDDLLNDIEDKETFEKSYAGLSSLLLDSPSDNEASAYPDYCGSVEVPSLLLDFEALGPEYRNGVICCTLNTEDLEVPSNDDVFLPYRSNETSYLVPSSIKNYSSTQKGDENNNHAHHSHDRGLPTQLNASSDLKTAERKVKFMLPNSNTHCETPGITRECRWTVGKIADNEDSHNLFRKEVLVREETIVTGSSHAESREKGIVNDVNEAVPSDQPKFEPEPENEFDVPCSSDVEAMILDMDLRPDEFDLYTHPEVQKYRREETKRRIVRLEQAMNACMQRELEAKGAFAVLYSRNFKQYITKPEVLLGRATEDTKVDIDLGGVEKKGSKISRRQAFVVMDANGSFHMKNLGTYPIFVNGNEVATSQTTCLQSGCLLEIRGLPFVFEMNHAKVKQYVDHMNTNIFLQQEVR